MAKRSLAATSSPVDEGGVIRPFGAKSAFDKDTTPPETRNNAWRSNALTGARFLPRDNIFPFKTGGHISDGFTSSA